MRMKPVAPSALKKRKSRKDHESSNERLMEIEDHIISKQTEKPAKVTKYPNAIIIRITYEY